MESMLCSPPAGSSLHHKSRARWSMTGGTASTSEATPAASGRPASPSPSGQADFVAQAAALLLQSRDALSSNSSRIKRAPTTATAARRSTSAPPEESSCARAARQVGMNDPLPAALAEETEQAEGSAAVAGGQQQEGSKNPAKASGDGKAQRRRSTRNAKGKQKDASDSVDDDDDVALLPPTTTLLFTTSPPDKMTFFEAPPLPVTLQTLIEVPDFRVLTEGEMPLGRLRIQPNSGQQTDLSDEYYLKRHAQGEALERKGRKQERDRLVIERNRIKHRVEQLKLEVASASFYANPSPVKPAPPLIVGPGAASSVDASPSISSGAAARGSRHSTPVVSERLRESERNKRRQLQEAEDTLRRYDELLQPREPYIPVSAEATNGTASNVNAPRTWLTGGKGIPPPPDGVQPIEFLNAPRGATLISLNRTQAPQARKRGGKASVGQRILAQVESRNTPSSMTSQGSASGSTPPISGRVTRSRPASPAVLPSTISYAPIAPAPVASSSGSILAANKNNNNTSPQRFIPILPRPSTSGSFIPAERRSGTTVSATGPSSLTLKIRQSVPLQSDIKPDSSFAVYQPTASTSNVHTRDGALASRRRTRALQPIDISLSRDVNYTSQYYDANNLSSKRTALDATQWHQPLATGQIRPRKKRKRRRRKGESSEEDDGALEAELEMEASKEFLEDVPDETTYINSLKSSYAAAFDHKSPLGTPDDPHDADNETPRTATSSGRVDLIANKRRNSSQTKVSRKESKAAHRPAGSDFKDINTSAALDDTTDLSDGGLMAPPPAPPILPSIHIDRASSASLSTDDVVRKVPRQASTRASTPASNSVGSKSNRRPPRQLFHKPDKPVDALLDRNRSLVPEGRKRSPFPGKLPHRSSSLVPAAAPPLTASQRAALTFESEGDLSSLPSDTDDGGDASEFHDSESRFKSERALWRLETSDTIAPAFLGSKGASHGATPLATSVLPGGDDGSIQGVEVMLDPILAAVPTTRGQASRTAASATSEASAKVASQVTVGGLKTRKRPLLEDYPVNDLNELSESEMNALRKSYQHVAARKKEMMGAKFLEMPVGDWQVYAPESDTRHT